MAVTTNAQPIAQALNVQNSQILNGTGNVGTGATYTSGAAPTNGVLAYTAGANGSRILAILATSDDTSARMITLFRKSAGGTDTGNSYVLWSVNVPASSGINSGVPNVDLMGSPIVGLPLDATNKPILALKPNDTLYIGSQTTLTAAKTVSVTVIGEDF